MLLALVCAGGISGSLASARTQSTWSALVPEGPITLIALAVEDGTPERPGVVRPEALLVNEEVVRWRGPALAVDLPAGAVLVAGDRVRIEGIGRARPGKVRGDPVAGRIAVQDVERIGNGRGPLFAVGNAVRGRVASVIPGRTPSEGLVSGFLIGDTSNVPARDLDALRRSGLTHFVAVSGSNVALFLAGWWLLTSPLGRGSRRRFAIGLVGLAVFVVVTRWEGSVLRAATMAGLILGGAATGIAVDGWMALGGAASLLLLASGNLALDVGFQLSVAATAGILVGAGAAGNRRPRWAWTVLAAAVSAQIAVVPILLWNFGSIPLLSPVANLLAAPLVTVATIVGGLAVVTGWAVLVTVASSVAGVVLAIARLAAAWPQLGTVAVLVVGATGAVAINRRLRPVVAVVAALVLAAMTVAPVILRSGPTVIVLDVGQGDAILVRSQGRVALIDGGRDPLVLADRLRSHGVGRIDLLVVTHGDADHSGGLDGIVTDHGVGRIWVPEYADLGELVDRLVDDAAAAGVQVEWIDAGSPRYTLGAITIEPIGPKRRYASDNDGSIVVWVEAARSMLLGGDIEAIAQTELPAVRPDFLLVPHHGSGSTDAQWLADTVGDTAVVSVGENRYGHPLPEIMTILERSGAEVLVTAEEGDVTVKLD